MAKRPESDGGGDFLAALEAGIRKVLADPKATAGERTQAIVAGTKIALARWRIAGGEERGFFE